MHSPFNIDNLGQSNTWRNMGYWADISQTSNKNQIGKEYAHFTDVKLIIAVLSKCLYSSNKMSLQSR